MHDENCSAGRWPRSHVRARANDLHRHLVWIRLAGYSADVVNRDELSQYIESASRAASDLLTQADSVHAAYLRLVHAALDRIREAANLEDWEVVWRSSDLVHNVDLLFTAPASWDHTTFLSTFVDSWALDEFPEAIATLRDAINTKG